MTSIPNLMKGCYVVLCPVKRPSPIKVPKIIKLSQAALEIK